jgi:ADP-heptose:LPS heptosyltransferase
LKKILIIRFSSIGDIVLASPVFRCVKKQLENTSVHFLTKQSFKAVTQHNPYIDQFHYFDNNMGEIMDILKAESFDCVIDLHNNIRSNKIKNALGVKSYTINKLTLQKFFLTKLKLNFMPGNHITQRSLQTVEAIGIKDDGLGLDYFIAEHDEVSINDIPASHHLGYVAIVIGANHYTKKLPVYKLQELCQKINYPIILIGGKDEINEGESIAAVDNIKIYNACGKFSLNESADLVKKSKLVVSHDTGFQYIACAFQKQVLAIWGGTSPKLDVEPYYGSRVNNNLSSFYENISLNLWCQPCSKYGRSSCPLGHFKCMKKQDIDLITQKVHERLRQ